MTPQSFAAVLHHFRRLSRFWTAGDDANDAVLLERFTCQRDREAFAELVERHGPLVLRVCRRILVREPDVEDAFQATFLILARKARTIQRQRSIASWLYTVAQRVAWSTRSGISRRQAQEQQVPDMRWLEEELSATAKMGETDPAHLAQRRELEAVIEQEVGRLPEKYRGPLILCDLQGRTHTEAARELGLPQGSVSRHLERGRDLLRERLVRRGVSLGAAALATLLAETAQAAVPTGWVEAAAQAAVLWASGSAIPAGLISARALSLSQGVLRAMWMKKLKIILLGVLTLGLLGGGAGFLGFSASGADPGKAAKAPPAGDKENPGAKPARQEALPPGVRLRFSVTEKPKEQQGMVFYLGVKDGGLFFSADGETLYVQRGGLSGAIGAGVGGVGLLGGGAGVGGGAGIGGGGGVVPPNKKPGGRVPPPDKQKNPQGGGVPGGGFGIGGGGALPGGGGGFGIGGGAVQAGGGAVGFGGGVGFGGAPNFRGGPGMLGFPNMAPPSLSAWSVASGKKVKEVSNNQVALLSPSGKSIGAIALSKNKQVVRLLYPKTLTSAMEADLWAGGAGAGVGGGIGGGGFGGGGFGGGGIGMVGGFGGFLMSSGGLAFTADGKRMAVSTGLEVRQWEITTGKLSRGLGCPLVGIAGYMPDGKALVGLGMPKGFGMLGGNPLAPGGAPAPAGDGQEGRVVVWDLTTSKTLRSFGDQLIQRAILAPKGTTVATFSYNGLIMGGFGMGGLGGLGGIGGIQPQPPAGAGNKENTAKIQLWDASTGKLLTTCDTKIGPEAGQQKLAGANGMVMFSMGAVDAAFSEDGRFLASTIGVGEAGYAHLWEVKTGRELAKIQLPFCPQAVALSRDGTMLAAAGALGPLEIRIWEVASLVGSKSDLKFEASQFPGLWNDLASDDLSKALRAERALSSGSPSAVLPLLKEKLKPVQTSTEEGRRLAQLLADLESDQFKVRDKATQELARGGVAAGAALRNALSEKHTIEFQKRAEALLTKLEQSATLTPDQRRQQRALLVLEGMGTPAAGQFIDQLAGGAPEVWFTQEARASRQRLGEPKQGPATP